jgi:AcrR family transcriptional regulator
MVQVKSRRSQHSEDTRVALIKSARRLFSELGYGAVTLDEVCDRARVTKGALYHHFRNKEDLFAAVLQQVEAGFVEVGAAAVRPGADLWQALPAAGAALLDACARRDVRRIVVEGPAVLGWERCREIENDHAVGLLQAALERAVEDGSLKSRSPEVLAQLLGALFNEAGMIVAGSEDPDETRAIVRAELDRVISGMRLDTADVT